MTIVRSSVSNVSSLIDDFSNIAENSKSRFPTLDLDDGEKTVVRVAEIRPELADFSLKAN
jgi:nitrogen fixation/metabolism regulation signal transduction histidine kinase